MKEAVAEKNPYIHEAQFHLGSRSLNPELPRIGQTRNKIVVEKGKLYNAVETHNVNIGTSIAHLRALNAFSTETNNPLNYTSVYLRDEGGIEYHVEKNQTVGAWTIQRSDSKQTYKLDLEHIAPFIVGHHVTYAHQGRHGEKFSTKKIKSITVVDRSHAKELPALGHGSVERNKALVHQIKQIKIDKSILDKKPEHVQRTISLFDHGKKVGYVAGYHPYERNEGLHMHESENVLEVLEGEFEVCIFNPETGWGPRFIARVGDIMRLDPMTPHLVAPAEDKRNPNKLNIIKIVTDRPVDIAPGQGYNVGLPSDFPRELPPLEQYYRRQAA